MQETITLYSEIIEEIVNGTFSKTVIEVREASMIRRIIGWMNELVEEQSGTEKTSIRLPINLLLHIDNDTGDLDSINQKLPQKYQDYFFVSHDKAMEVINQFVLNTNDIFAHHGLKASITTAKVAARLRAQLLHALTSEKFEHAHFELLAVNDGVVTFHIENPLDSIKHLESLI